MTLNDDDFEVLQMHKLPPESRAVAVTSQLE